MVLRINAALVFLSLCLGDVLIQFVAPDANQFVTLFSAHGTKAVSSNSYTMQIILLALPVVLTAVFMIRTVKGYGKLALNILPAAGVGLLGALLLTPLLPRGMSIGIIDSPLWSQLQKGEDLIVGLSALICLLVLWLQRPKTGHDKEKHSKH